MIEIRDDDVLVPSRSWKDPFGRFKQLHEWIKDSNNIIHVPTIVVNSIKEFPECISYIKEETAIGRMRPEIHGLDHIDYKKLPKALIMDHLNSCKDFIYTEFHHTATQWYTPWGANASHLYEAAHACDLELIDCSHRIILEGPTGLLKQLENGIDISTMDSLQIFLHWWGGGSRLARFCAVSKYGNWEEAKKNTKGLF